MLQPPARFDEDMAHAWIAVLGDGATLAPFARRVFAGHQPGIAGDLPAVLEPTPVADLAVENLGGEGTEAGG